MKNQIIPFLSLIILLMHGACSDDYKLKETIFIPDRQNPGLPVYSEMGYNTFGAYYNRVTFVAGDETPAIVIVENNTTSFKLIGKKGMEEIVLVLTIAEFDPAQYTDLISVNNTTFDLSNTQYSITIRINGEDFDAEILNGSFKFQRAQNLLVDKESFEVILSGTFNFQAIINEEPVTIENGRFDVGIGTHNFYHY